MCIISHVNEDCLTLITSFLTMKETLLLTMCNNDHRNFLMSQETIWKQFISIPRPLWIPNYYSFALKIFNKSSSTCTKCDRRLSRFCVLIICDCTVNFEIISQCKNLCKLRNQYFFSQMALELHRPWTNSYEKKCW